MMRRLSITAALLVATLSFSASAAIVYETGFEAPDYSTGDVDGQAGWSTPVGPADRVRVRNDVPREGGQSLWSASGGGGVAGTGAFRNLSADLSTAILTISSRVAFSTGNRSDWEFNSAFGSAGFLAGIRILGNNEIALQTGLGSTNSGVFVGGFQTLALVLDYGTGLASALRNGVEIISGVAFDASNNQLARVAAVKLITARRMQSWSMHTRWM